MKKTGTNYSADTVRLMKLIAKLLEKVTPGHLADYLQKEIETGSFISISNKKVISEFASSSLNEDKLKFVVASLQELNSREEGRDFIAEHLLNRKGLEALARLLSVPVMKSDNVERIKEKIIEASIGARLNSNAIQGKTSGT